MIEILIIMAIIFGVPTMLFGMIWIDTRPERQLQRRANAIKISEAELKLEIARDTHATNHMLQLERINDKSKVAV